MTTTGEAFASDIRAAKAPGGPVFHLPQPSVNPLNWMGGIWRATVAAANTAEHAVVGAAELTATLLSPAPESSLTGPVTRMLRDSAARVHLADMKQVCRAVDVTLNDVALAAITNSYRTILLDRGEKPGPNSVRALVAVSVRSVNDFGVTDNRVSAMLPLLPVDEPDPVKQLEVVHSRLIKAKGSGQREGGSALFSAAKTVPFAFSAWTIRLMTRLPQKSVTAGATNVPGPPEAPAGDGPAGVGSPADTADRSSSAHRDRDGQLRRQFLFLASPPTMTPHQTSTNSPTASRTG